MNINYRQGSKGDCRRIAELDYIASDGVVEYLFRDLVPGKSALDILADGLALDVYPHTFRSSIVAQSENQVVGMSLSYPAHFHCITDELTNFLPADRLAVFHEFYASRVEGSYFLDAICVDKNCQGLGIGKALLEHTKRKAGNDGYSELSLIVFADNKRAIKLYEDEGFRRISKINLQSDELLQHDEGCLLMSVKL
jgi:ribosomal protein S18 acetylase RimI-like enzyme